MTTPTNRTAYGTGGDHGKRLHLLQFEGRWIPVCVIDSQWATGRPVEGRGREDVTCKKCLDFAKKARVWHKF